MHYFVLLLLIGLNVVHANNCLLEEPRHDCYEYCYSSVKPFLSYIPLMQKRLEACETLNPPYTHDRLNKIDTQLAQQLELTKSWHKKLDSCQSAQSDLNKSVGACNQNLTLTQSKLDDMGDQLRKQLEIVNTCQSSLKSHQILAEKCRKERKRFQKIGHKFYYFENFEKLTWIAALQRCSKWGGHLVSLQSEKEWINVTKELTNGTRYWVDANDIEKEGTFVSATNGEAATFLKWLTGEPSNWKGLENCVEIGYKSFQMNDLQCHFKRNFICESKTEFSLSCDA